MRSTLPSAHPTCPLLHRAGGDSTHPTEAATTCPPHDAPKPEVGVTYTSPITPARDQHVGRVKGRPTGIQFFVLPKEIIVHLVVCSFEIINIRLVRCWSWELHVGSCSKGPDTESPFAERHGRRENHSRIKTQTSQTKGYDTGNRVTADATEHAFTSVTSGVVCTNRQQSCSILRESGRNPPGRKTEGLNPVTRWRLSTTAVYHVPLETF